jgi:hypothetical protein
MLAEKYTYVQYLKLAVRVSVLNGGCIDQESQSYGASVVAISRVRGHFENWSGEFSTKIPKSVESNMLIHPRGNLPPDKTRTPNRNSKHTLYRVRILIACFGLFFVLFLTLLIYWVLFTMG